MVTQCDDRSYVFLHSHTFTTHPLLLFFRHNLSFLIYLLIHPPIQHTHPYRSVYQLPSFHNPSTPPPLPLDFLLILSPTCVPPRPVVMPVTPTLPSIPPPTLLYLELPPWRYNHHQPPPPQPLLQYKVHPPLNHLHEPLPAVPAPGDLPPTPNEYAPSPPRVSATKKTKISQLPER